MGYDPLTAGLMVWGFAGFLLVMAALTATALCLRAAGISLGGDTPRDRMRLSATFRFRLPAPRSGEGLRLRKRLP